MTDSTRLAEIADRIDEYLRMRPAEDLIDWAGGGAGPELRASDLRALLTEIESLTRWKAEALPVLTGLQKLGKALGLPLGEQITGAKAVEAAEGLTARIEVLGDEGTRYANDYADALARAEAAEAALVVERAKVERVRALVDEAIAENVLGPAVVNAGDLLAALDGTDAEDET